MANQAHHTGVIKMEGHAAHSHHDRHKNEREQEPKNCAKDQSSHDAIPSDHSCEEGEY